MERPEVSLMGMATRTLFIGCDIVIQSVSLSDTAL